MIHGLILLVSALLLPRVLNLVPLASLAAFLLLVGYKLSKPALYVTLYKLGNKQFVLFIVTVGAIVFTDLLPGIFIGMLFGIFNILLSNYRLPFLFEKSDRRENTLVLRLGQEVSFLNKGALIQTLTKVDDGCRVVIDGSKSETIDYDIIEVVNDFREQASNRNIEVEVIGIDYRMSKNCVREFITTVKKKD